MQEDRQLVEDFLKFRSQQAFSRLYRAKTPHLYQMALRLTGQSSYEAEELIQQMWIVAIRRLEIFEWRSTLKTWLTGILINLNREVLNKLVSKKKAEEGLETVQQVSHNTQSIYDLELALSTLAKGYRQVIILHDIEGYTHKEISAWLGISEGTSKSQLFQARKAMREALMEQK